MIVVIQCAKSKRKNAGRLLTATGESVEFVASPGGAPKKPAIVYARPDDRPDGGKSWRDVLIEYNDQKATDNPFGLKRAFELYRHPTYNILVRTFGVEKVYILSAGWGLIRADFLTPYYDITFSNASNVECYMRRKRSDRGYQDFPMPPDKLTEEIVFFGGKPYCDLFIKLTSHVNGQKTVFYKSTAVQKVEGYRFLKFEHQQNQNWHYRCAKLFADDQLLIDCSNGLARPK